MNYKEQIKHPNWQKKRLEILERDNFTCRVCESVDLTLHVHHIHYYKGNMIWEYDNIKLLTLCECCHVIWHEIYDKYASDQISRFAEVYDSIERENIKLYFKGAYNE